MSRRADAPGGVPISVGGRTVRPDDVVFADESGGVVLDPPEAEAMAGKAIAAQEREVHHVGRLHKGELPADMTGATAMVEKALVRAV